jgi:hypothetical protein
MPICAEAEIVMWTRRFCSYFRHIFHHFNTQYHDFPPYSHHPNYLPPYYIQFSTSSNFKSTTDRYGPSWSPCHHFIHRFTTSVTSWEWPARCLYPGQLIGLLFPQETARITATVGRLVGTDGNCAIFALSGTWCRHEHLAIPLRWIWVVEDWREQWKCWGRNLSGRIFLPMISFDFYDFMIWFFFYLWISFFKWSLLLNWSSTYIPTL